MHAIRSSAFSRVCGLVCLCLSVLYKKKRLALSFNTKVGGDIVHGTPLACVESEVKRVKVSMCEKGESECQ